MNEEEKEQQQQQPMQFSENSTKILLQLSTSLAPDRTRTMINVIYILGIVFMIAVFLVLLWINLYSQRCWCWHDTPLINRFNRQWLSKHSMARHTDTSSPSNPRRHGRPSDDDIHM